MSFPPEVDSRTGMQLCWGIPQYAGEEKSSRAFSSRGENVVLWAPTLSGIAPTAFEGYFKRNCHNGMNTRGSNKRVAVPKVKSENGKKTFMLQGAKVFNMKPNEIQDSQELLFFK